MAQHRNLRRKLLLVKLLQNSRRRRKEMQQKILFLLTVRRMLLLEVFFLSALLISSEKTTADRSCRRLPRNKGWFEEVWNTYTDQRFKKTFRVSKATFNSCYMCLFNYQRKNKNINLCKCIPEHD